jgi:hypothetical protein
MFSKIRQKRLVCESSKKVTFGSAMSLLFIICLGQYVDNITRLQHFLMKIDSTILHCHTYLYLYFNIISTALLFSLKTFPLAGFDARSSVPQADART